jgi:hypothetical protein
MISVMVQFVLLRRDLFPLLDVRSSVRGRWRFPAPIANEYGSLRRRESGERAGAQLLA